MQNKTETAYLAECRQRIETRLGWGDSGLWTNQDFENLSEKIREDTQVHLSVTTLKRIWGKVKYDSLPTVTTLNTLARFAGFENWRVFRQDAANKAANDSPAHPQSQPPQSQTHRDPAHLSQENPQPLTRHRRTWVWAGAAMLLITGIGSFYFARRKPGPVLIDPAQYQFAIKKMLPDGVPNSVVFDYDATASPVDSVYIQQSWDPSRRKKVSREQHQFTSVYYYPGFFKARLVVRNQVVKEYGLIIKTKGWLPVVEQMPMPVYFEEREVMGRTAHNTPSGEIGLSLEQIRAKNITLQPQTPWVRYSNIGNWGDVRTDSFRFEASVRNDYREGSAICQQTEIRLLCEGAAIIIPLCDRGCISTLNMMLVDKFISGKDQDLSILGVDFHDWVHFACEAANGQFRILLNHAVVYQAPMPGKPVKIIGVDFRFQGTGRIKDVKLDY